MAIAAVDWSQIEWTAVRKGVHRKAFSGSGLTLALHRLEPHQDRSPHAHPHEQAIYVLQGRVRYFVGDDEVVLGPGGVLTIPPNVIHSAEVVGQETALALDVFTPRRSEYA